MKFDKKIKDKITKYKIVIPLPCAIFSGSVLLFDSSKREL